MDQTNDSYEVVVIGGAAAGLAGAVALLRSRRSVLLVDGGDPRNAPAGHVHNFLTQDGTAPDVLYAAGRTEVQAYGGQILRGDVDTLERDGELFRIQVQGRTVTARRVLVATGARDELPDIAGLAERWGIDVVHCPYCASPARSAEARTRICSSSASSTTADPSQRSPAGESWRSRRLRRAPEGPDSEFRRQPPSDLARGAAETARGQP
jgi:thioredoxin reductase